MQLDHKDKPITTSTSAPQSASLPDITKEAAQDKSWGEKHASKVFSWTRNWGLNYFVNFMAAASFTYAVDTSKVGAQIREFTTKTAEKHKNTIPPKVTEFVVKFFTRTQLLLCGGHVLLPVLKWMKDNQKRQEYAIGHKLDLLQDMLGKGNAATQRRLEEHSRLSHLISVGDHNRTHKDKITVDLTEKDKVLLAAHGLNEDLQFMEKKTPWKDAIKARLTGVACTTTTGILMGISSGLPNKWMRFQDTYETPAGKVLGDKVFARIPGMSRIFSNPNPIPGRDLTGIQMIGEYFIDDAIFTAASKFGFDKMEKAQEKKAAEREAREAAAHKKLTPEQDMRAGTMVEKAFAQESQGEAIRRMAEQKPGDFRTREETRPLSGMAAGV